MLRAALVLALAALVPSVHAQEPVSTEAEPAIELQSEVAAPDRLHLQADFLYWYLRRLRVPSLLTSGPEGSSAILGDRGTEVLRGGDRLESRHDRYVGVRSIADWWFDDERTFAFQADVFIMERDS